MNELDINKSISRLKEVLNDPYCERMNLSTIKGYLGELIILKMLKEEGLNVAHLGNQTGYDIDIADKGIKIDVKLSLLKSEIKHFPRVWGWALLHTNKKKKMKCTHFILVALNENYELDNIFIIEAKHLSRFKGSPLGQFGKVIKAFMLAESTPIKQSEGINNKIYDYFMFCKKLQDDGVVVRVPKGGKISSYLK